MEHIQPILTTPQLNNLKKLAAYLKKFPDNYGHFDMAVYFDIGDGMDGELNPTEAIEHQCGAVACAIGHGVAAGIEVIDEDDEWDDYAAGQFGAFNAGGLVYNWCFHHRWGAHDNTPRGASARILYMLEHGAPEAFQEESALLTGCCFFDSTANNDFYLNEVIRKFGEQHAN